MILYPKLYLKNILEIDINLLKMYNIQGLILDVDNTLINYKKEMLEGTDQWIDTLKENNIKICILSNSNKKEKIKTVANKLDIPYIYFGKKPFKKGFIRAKDILKLDYQNIAVVGDQVFTDIVGANRIKMFSILVKPIDNKESVFTLLKRPLENYIIKKYLKSIKKEK